MLEGECKYIADVPVLKMAYKQLLIKDNEKAVNLNMGSSQYLTQHLEYLADLYEDLADLYGEH